ncbi:threonine/serine ThrE exporter family protein [Enhydrobacter aerosaccus]|uniref:threonine/serine ThrE exporter family protein n=1 Tax=Enhydrobacter aerosaccus TaxID=225324 RepID=UPI0014821DA6|nr:threonine/serine exporter family protein [Enhydrobacter aerosaccus]
MSTDPFLNASLEVILRFGSLMVRTGDAGFRIVAALKALAAKVGLDDLAVNVAVTTITATATRNGEHLTLVREVGPLGINAAQLMELERLAQDDTRAMRPEEIDSALDRIERTAPLHSWVTVSLAIGLTCASFSYLNGGDLPGTLAAIVGGAFGQALRMALSRRHLNQYMMTAICALAAAGMCHLLLLLLAEAGEASHHGIGILASMLFLVPGFPLVAGLLDLLQRQTVAAVVRLTYGATLLAAAAFGLGIVVAFAGYSLPEATVSSASPAVVLILRGGASFIGGVGFALLYNSPWRVACAVGLLTLVGNELRLSLYDAGVTLASATFVGAFTAGLLASLARRLLRQPRIVLSVPSIIIMVPGSYAFQATVLFGRGDVQAGLQAAVVVAFVVGAMALGLATARFVGERQWLFET